MPTTDPQTEAMTPEQIYNLIMELIEPELTTDMLPLLDELYATETPEARGERGKRYAAAFEEFEKQYRKFVDGWKNHYMNIRAQALKLKREADENGASGDTSSIEESLSQS